MVPVLCATYWFKLGVGVVTLISATALLYYAGHWPIGTRSIAGWLVFFFCLLGPGRAWCRGNNFHGYYLYESSHVAL